MRRFAFFVVANTAMLWAPSAQAQDRSRPPEFSPPEVSADRKITFRIHAPNSKSVRLTSSDIPGLGLSAAMKKEDNGVWETTVGPVVPGAYRYNFNVDGVSVIDPRNPSTSESNLT
jgi:1,4-alpha-glucan branching enzyme